MHITKYLKSYHLILGIGLVIFFVWTGQYLRATLTPEIEGETALRMMRKSRHIYILFSALIHACLGIYLRSGNTVWSKSFQLLASVLLSIATYLFINGFFNELSTEIGPTPMIHYGTYLSLAGVIGHFLSFILDVNVKNVH